MEEGVDPEIPQILVAAKHTDNRYPNGKLQTPIVDRRLERERDGYRCLSTSMS